MNQYRHLISKDKKSVLSELVQELNYYHNDIWIYHLHASWIGRRKVLVIYFSGETVNKIKIINYFGKKYNMEEVFPHKNLI